METARVRLPRPRSQQYISSAYDENLNRPPLQRYTFPNIPSTYQSQRRTYSQYSQQISQQNQHRRSSQLYDERPSPVKPVYKLMCNHCSTPVCARGMKAILLADTTIELYSTDTPSQCIYVLEKDYLTRSCHCRIRDVACLECGNVIGYHVVSPCSQCLESCNNGHFWMFHSNACRIVERHDRNRQIVLWNNLPRAEMDLDFIMGASVPYDQLCR